MNLIVGDTFWVEVEPFLAEVIVIRVISAGAEIQYTERTKFVGYAGRMVADDGAQLTTSAAHGFLGRTHWAAIEEVIPGNPDEAVPVLGGEVNGVVGGHTGISSDTGDDAPA